MPTLPQPLVEAYLRTVPHRPGLIPLVAKGYEACGPTFPDTWKASHPLVFETGLDECEYAIAGTGFLAGFRDRLFVITAKHCIGSGSGDDLRVACNPTTKTFLPLQALHKATSPDDDNAFTDFAIFEAKAELLTDAERRALNFLDLRRLAPGWRHLRVGDRLTVPGFPKRINYVDPDRAKLIERRYVPSGIYEGPTTDVHVHRIRFPDLEQVETIDGMSGSPVLFVRHFPKAFYYGFAGVLVQGGKEALMGRFIESPVIIHALNEICKMPPSA